MNPKVSVIIATYNRYDSLLIAIESVKNQTYKNIELIVVNDASTDHRYYSLQENGFKLIHLKENTKYLFGFPCSGYVRRIGIENSTGDYIAILDDDDMFFNIKLATQINEMYENGYKICSSDALAGNGTFKFSKRYHFYLQGLNKDVFRQFFFYNKSPFVIKHDMMQKNNFVIHSSLVFERALYDIVGGFESKPNGDEDYHLILKMLKYSDCLLIDTPLLYYNARINESIIYKLIAIIKRSFLKN